MPVVLLKDELDNIVLTIRCSMNLHLEIDKGGRVRTKHYRTKIWYQLTHFYHSIYTSVHAMPAYWVYICQLFRYSRACDFLGIDLMLTKELLNQGIYCRNHFFVNVSQLSPLLECDPTVCLPEKSKVTRGLSRGLPNFSRGDKPSSHTPTRVIIGILYRIFLHQTPSNSIPAALRKYSNTFLLRLRRRTCR
jgi:hypothetical protein